MPSVTVIVFGATGRVGSATARAAAELGAKVVLALRDPQKTVPGLTAEQGGGAAAGSIGSQFERVQADLTQPDSVAAAVRQTGATRAFLYVLPGRIPDHLRATAAALRDAGVELAVLLSSASVHGEVRTVPPSQFVPFAHAQAEASLDDVFGAGGYVAVRPTYFASNALWWQDMVRQRSEVRTVYPEARVDWITPGDIGRVCGSLLAAGPQAAGGAKETAVYLVGPKLVSLRDVAGYIGKAIGKDVKVTQVGEEEGIEIFVKERGMPEILARDLVAMFKGRAAAPENETSYSGLVYEEVVGNVQKYGGRRPANIEEWVEENKHEFET